MIESFCNENLNDYDNDMEFLIGISGDNSDDVLNMKTQIIFCKKIIGMLCQLKMIGNEKAKKYVTLIGTLKKTKKFIFHDSLQTDLFLDVKKERTGEFTVHCGIPIGLKRTHEQLLQYSNTIMTRLKSNKSIKMNTVCGIRLDPTQQAQVVEYEDSDTDDED